MSNAPQKFASAALSACLAVGGPVATLTGLAIAGVAMAPAAQAAAAFCCSVSYSVSPTDPSAVTATFKNSASTGVTVTLTYTKGSTVVKTETVPLPKAISNDGYDASGNWVWGTPSSTPVNLTVPAGETVTPSVSGIAMTSYTNNSAPAVPSYPAAAPTQVGNTITIPTAPAGAYYVVVGGASKPLPAGYVITLSASMPSLTLSEQFDPTKVTVTGNATWTFNYVPPAPAQLTPQGPTHVSGNLWTIPAVSGYHYEANGQVVPAGDYYVPAGGVTLVAVSDSAQLQLVGTTSWKLPYATPPKPDQGTTKVTICHATGSAKNPYVSITVSVASLRGPDGHAGHDGDIFPAFTYRAADDLVVTVPAHNWSPATQKIYEANCTVEVPTPPPGDTGDHGGNNGGDHGGNTGGNTGNTGGNGGNTGSTTTGGNTGSTTTGGNTTTSSSTVTTTTQTQSQASATTQAASSTGEVMKADTAASPTDPANLFALGGVAVVLTAVGAASLLQRRPRHRA